MTRLRWGQIATTVGFLVWLGPTLALGAVAIPSLRQLACVPHSDKILIGLAWAFLLLPPVASSTAWILTGPESLLRYCAALQLFAWLLAVGITAIVATS